MTGVNLFAINRQVERAAMARDRSELTFDAAMSPLEHHRDVSGVRSLETVRAVAPSILETPLRDALGPWIADLLLARLSYEARRDLRMARRSIIVVPPSSLQSSSPDGSARAAITWDHAWSELLSANAERAATWLDAIATQGHAMASAAREARGRVREARSRVAEKLDVYPEPLWQKLGWAMSEQAALELAESVLRVTDAIAADVTKAAHHRHGTSVATDVLLDALARDATSSFPARIVPRWFDEVFTAGRHLSGIRGAFALPQRIVGGATFARALASFGRALRVSVASELPFALRASPSAVDAERFAVVFGALAVERSFLRRALGASKLRADEDRRAFGRTLLFETRLRAVRVLLGEDDSRFEELTTRLFGRPLPGTLAGAWPCERGRGGDIARLGATVSGPHVAHELTDRFDEDWFANPRAFQWIEARGSVTSSETPLEDDALARVEGPRALARSFEEILA